jgi:hypothetical protein
VPERSNAERLRELYDAFWHRGDWDAGAGLFAPDVVWIVDLPGVRGSGLGFGSAIGQVWEFRDGLVVRQTMYRTREEARRAADLLLGER